MLSENKYKLEEFEKEIWLYLDKSLPKERMQFWENEIATNKEINEVYEETLSFLEQYDEVSEFEIEDEKFDLMLEKTVSKGNFLDKLKRFFLKLKQQEMKNYSLSKIVLSGSFVTVLLILVLTRRTTNTVNIINVKMQTQTTSFVLDDEEISENIKALSTIVKDIKQEYYETELENSPWESNIYKVRNQLTEMKKELTKQTL